MSHPRTPRLAAAALGLTILLGACGSGAASSPSTTGSSGAGNGATGTPLEQLLSGSSASQRALEDEIAACMRERGWQYTPNTAALTQSVSFGGNDPAFRAQYGYGISTQPPAEAFGGLVGTTGDRSDDPNLAYQQTLGEADQARYLKDLYGEMSVAMPTDSGGGEVAAAGPDANSCMGRAQTKVAKDHPELSTEFATRVSELMTGLEKDPAMVAAMGRWSACMAKANFTYTSLDEVYQDLQQRASAILGTDGGGPGGATVVIGGEGGGPTSSLSASDQDRLSKLQTTERAIAKADDACRADTIDKARPALEQQVVDKLRSEFPGVGSGK